MTRPTLLITVLATLALLRPAVAQDLYRFSEGASVEIIWPQSTDPRFKAVFAMDSTDYLYGSGVAGQISRWSPEDPDGTYQALKVTSDQIFWNANHSDMRFAIRDLNNHTVSFGSGWCFDGSLTKPRKLCEIAGPYAWPADWDLNYTSAWTWAPDGRYCAVVRHVGFVCAAPGEDELNPERVIDVDTLSDIVTPNPGFAIGYVLEDPPVAIWEVAAAQYMPNGDLIAMVQMTWGVGVPLGGVIWQPYVIRRLAADNSWRLHTDIGPAPDATEAGHYAPWGSITAFYNEPALGGVIGWPAGFDWDFTTQGAPSGTPGQGSVPAKGPTGQTGMLFGNAGSGGQVSLTGVQLRELEPLTILGQHPKGGLLVRLGADVGRIVWDLETLDNDQDSLSWATEAMLGSSDFSKNSDGSPTLDSVEVALGMNPTVRGDEGPLPRSARTTTYSPSSAIFWHLPDAVAETITGWGLPGLTAGGSVEGPLCMVKGAPPRCIWLDGTSIPLPDFEGHTFLGYTSAAAATKSADGTHIAWLTNNGMKRFFFADGLQDVFMPPDALSALHLDAKSLLAIHPARHDLAFVSVSGILPGTTDTQMQLLAIEAGKEPRVIYDHLKARCDSELGDCNPLAALGDPSLLKDQHDLVVSPRTLGWNETLQAFELLVNARYLKYRVAIPLEGEPFIIETFNCCGTYLNGQWNWMLRLEADRYLTDAGEMHGSGYFLPTAFQDTALLSDAPAVGAFGHTVLHTDIFGNLVEQVRYEGTPQPGDALIVAQGMAQAAGNYGMNLFWSGPRGGAVPLWHLNQWWGDQTEITGADINRGGVMCVADYGNRALRRLEASGGIVGYSPVQVTLRDDFGAPPLDCVVEESGSTIVLLDDDTPRLVRIPVDFWATPEELGPVDPSGSLQVELEPLPMGGFQPLAAAGGIYCDDLTCYGGEALMLGPLVQLGVRPNGHVVAAEYRGLGGAPTLSRSLGSTQRVGLPALASSKYGIGLALIPGGEAVDPWTGDFAGSTTPDANSPPELKGGTPVGVSDGAPDGSSGGCATAPVSHGLPIVVILFGLCVVILRRLRRVGPKA